MSRTKTSRKKTKVEEKISAKEKKLTTLIGKAESMFDFGRLDTKYLDKNSKVGFSLLAGINRPIRPDQVTKLTNALYHMGGTIRPVVVAKIDFIDGTSKYYIIDGQHLYTALLRTNSSIPYKVVSVNSKEHLVETIALCNATSKSWTLGDYITAWSSVRPDYVVLNELVTKYDLEARTIVACYMNETSRSCSSIIKKGLFKIEDKASGDKLVQQLDDCCSVVPRPNRWAIDHFVNAALTVMRNNRKYNHVQFLDYLKKNKKQLSMLMQDTTAVLDFLNNAFKK